jgi:hypothetical protein
VQVGDDGTVEVDVLAQLDLLADGDGQALDELADGLVAEAAAEATPETTDETKED